MVETIGKKLCQARLARGLSIDEAAHATRVRPEKLIALEDDDYSRFGSNAYAKGFLQIYGRFLNVDVSDQVAALETPRQLTISDYQYLNNAPEPEVNKIQFRNYSGRPSVAPLVITVCLMLAALAGVMGFWINVNMQRLESKATARSQAASAAQTSTTNPSQAESGTTPSASLGLEASKPASQGPELSLGPVSEPRTISNPEGTSLGLLELGTTPTIGSEPASQPSSPGQTTDAPADGSGVVTTSPGVNELIVQPLKTTWVKIRRDSPSGTPVFEGDIYPSARPLKLHGARFFVEVRDQDAVQIRKNGHPIAYQAPGISIQ